MSEESYVDLKATNDELENRNTELEAERSELKSRIAKAKAILEQGRQWFVSQADIEGILDRALDALEGK